jgi:hypothetical protein
VPRVDEVYNNLKLKGFPENKIRGKRRNVTLFVSQSNYSIAVIGLVDPK